MRNIAVGGPDFTTTLFPYVEAIDVVEIEGIMVSFGLVHTKETPFDPEALENKDKVLVKVNAFSCNYRDKSIILRVTLTGDSQSFYVVGSEFVGTVVAVGAAVTSFQVGDRVIGNASWPSEVPGVPPGMPTEHASREFQLFHQAKLLKIPASMPDEVAAAFHIGAQTSYSMVRKLALSCGDNILVTAARSNTSLFTVNALRHHDVNIYATTTSSDTDRLAKMGVKDVIQVDTSQDSFLDNEELMEIVAATGGFDAVVDPFYDVYLDKVVGTIAPGGRYVTCGYYAQYHDLIGQDPGLAPDWPNVLNRMMFAGLHLIGNCLGQADDLQRALDDYKAGLLEVIIDSVFSGRQIGAFFERTFNSPDRFGKVVYRYE